MSSKDNIIHHLVEKGMLTTQHGFEWRTKRISSEYTGSETQELRDNETQLFTWSESNFPAKAENTGHIPWPALMKDKQYNWQEEQVLFPKTDLSARQAIL